MTSIADPFGNRRYRDYSQPSKTAVTLKDAANNVTGSYAVTYDNVGRKTEQSNAAGVRVFIFQYNDANNRYSPTTVASGVNAPGNNQIIAGGTGTVARSGYNGGPGYWLWSIWLAGSQITWGDDNQTNAQGWYVTYDIGAQKFTVKAPANAAPSAQYEVRWTGYPGYTLTASGTFEVANIQNPTQFTYDATGNATSVTDARGITTTYTWDYTNFALGRLTRIETAGKPATTFEYYEPSGLLKKLTGTLPTGGPGSVEYAYDALGNVLTVTGPGNGTVASITTTFNYTQDGAYTQNVAVGQALTATDNLGHTSHFRYDAQGRQVAQWDALGNRTDIAYDIYGQSTAVQLPATGQQGVGRTTLTSEYLYIGGPLVRSRVYNEAGTQIRETNYAYGADGANYRVWGDTVDTTFQYDSANRIAWVLDGNSNPTHYVYNESGNLARVFYANGDTVTYPVYNKSGQPLTQVDGRGVVTNFTYDPRDGALTDVQYPASPAYNIAYTYDSYGRNTGVANGEGSETYQYGSVDQLLSKTTTYTGVPAKTLSYGYNPDGSVHTLTTPAGAFAYIYDGAGRLTAMTNPSNQTTGWTYLDNDWLWTQTQSNGVVTTNTFNALGQRTDLVNSRSGSVLSQYTGMTYDGAGNRLGVNGLVTGQTTLSGATNWLYDIKDQLTREQSGRGAGYTHNFAYDATGNVTSFKGSTRAYNVNNQRTGSAFAYDANGNPTKYNNKTLVFDVVNNLISMTNSGATAPALTAGYRPDGLRAWKQGNGASTRRYFLYSGSTPIVEINSAGVVQATNTFGAAGLISRKSGSSHTWYTFDERGATSQRLGATGNVVSSHATDAYGVVTSVGSFGSDPFVGIGAQAGYYRDSETGLALCGFRYYDPANGRWLNRDPAGYGGGINLYGYCGNNPIMDVDPLGLSPRQGRGNQDTMDRVARIQRRLIEDGAAFLSDPRNREKVIAAGIAGGLAMAMASGASGPGPVIAATAGGAAGAVATIWSDGFNIKSFNVVKGASTLSDHYAKHGNVPGGVGERLEGRTITQQEYNAAARNFAQERSPAFQEANIENRYVVKYDPATQRTIILNVKERTILSFHTNDRNSSDPFGDAINFAADKVRTNSGTASPTITIR